MKKGRVEGVLRFRRLDAVEIFARRSNKKARPWSDQRIFRLGFHCLRPKRELFDPKMRTEAGIALVADDVVFALTRATCSLQSDPDQK